MRSVLLIVFLVLSFFVKGQNDTTIFKHLKEVASSDYVFKVPATWRNIPEIDISSKDKKYDFSGVGLPAEFNHAPVTATFNLRKYECSKKSMAEDYTIGIITSFPDRVTPPGQNYTTDSLKILSGEMATLYTTHYLRRSQKFNFSRYDLVVYSKKRKAAYMFTVLFEYRDPTYVFETDNRLKQYALAFFSNILLR